MKSIHMQALLRLEMMISELKVQLERDVPFGLEYSWNLTVHSQNIVLNLIDDLYEHSNNPTEDD